jgi:hypothetical protein
MAETTTIQERLYEAFRTRPVGMTNETSRLSFITAILARHGLKTVLRVDKDLLALTDAQAEIAMGLIHIPDIPRPDPALIGRLVADDVRRSPRRRSGT